MKTTYLYLTIIRQPGKHPLYYAGSRTWNGPEGELDPNYHGSAPLIQRLCRDGYKDWLQTRLVSAIDSSKKQYSKEESILIQKLLEKHGSYYRDHKYTSRVDGKQYTREWLKKYKQGYCINTHWNTMEQLHTPEVMQRAYNTYNTEKRREAAKKRSAKDPDFYKRFVAASVKSCKERGLYVSFTSHFQTVEAKEKAIKRRREIGYTEAAKKVAKSISGKEHFVCKPICVLGVVTGEFLSIKEAELYLESQGYHVTRATISQGLKRCNGVYSYKNILTFKYK